MKRVLLTIAIDSTGNSFPHALTWDAGQVQFLGEAAWCLAGESDANGIALADLSELPKRPTFDLDQWREWDAQRTGTWRAIAESLAWHAVAGSRSVAAEVNSTASVEFYASDRHLNAIMGWQRLLKLLSPVFSLMPDAEVLPTLAERSAEDSDKLVRALGLGFALALGCDAWVIAEVSRRHDSDHDRNRSAQWQKCGKAWSEYLSRRENLDRKAVELIIPYEPESVGREQFATMWIPAAMVRTVAVRLGMGPGRDEDFVTRFGLRFPWEHQRNVLWLTPAMLDDQSSSEGHLDNISTWFEALEVAAFALLARAASNPPDHPTTGFVKVQVPWWSQALGVTAVVADALGINYQAALKDGERQGPSIGASPNELHPDAAYAIQSNYVIEGRSFTAPYVAIQRSERNLASDALWAITARRRFIAIRRFEAELLHWWHALFFDPIYLDLDWIHGLEPDIPSVEEMCTLDYPITNTIKEGWLAQLIALYARNPKWPGEKLPSSTVLREQVTSMPTAMAVPRIEEIGRSGPDLSEGATQENVDVTDAGRPWSAKPLAGNWGWTPLRRLALAAWFEKPAAKRRVTEWLAAHPPRLQRPPNWDSVAPAAAIAFGKIVHGHNRDEAAIKVLIEYSQAAEELGNERGWRVSQWLERFLRYDVPFPKRPLSRDRGRRKQRE